VGFSCYARNVRYTVYHTNITEVNMHQVSFSYERMRFGTVIDVFEQRY